MALPQRQQRVAELEQLELGAPVEPLFWFKECSPAPETSGPTPPTGATRLDSQGYSALSDYLQTANPLLSILTYSLSPLSPTLPTASTA